MCAVHAGRWSSALRVGFVCLSVVALGALAACGSDDGTTVASTSTAPAEVSTTVGSTTQATAGTTQATTTSAPAVDPASVAKVGAAIEAADIADPETMDVVINARLEDGAADAATSALASGVTGDQLWAATWIYAGTGTDAEVLRPLLTNDDPTVTAIAAATLASWGDADGLPVLVDLLGEDSELYAANPPQTVSDFARYSLGRYVEGPEIAADAEPAAIADAWGTWMQTNGPTLTFDEESGIWSAA